MLHCQRQSIKPQLIWDTDKAKVMKQLFGMESMGGAIALLKVGSKNLEAYTKVFLALKRWGTRMG